MKKNKEQFAIKRLERILYFLDKLKQFDKLNSILDLLVKNGYSINKVENKYFIVK